MSRFSLSRSFESDLKKQAEHRMALRRAARPVAAKADALAKAANAPWMPRQKGRVVVVETDAEGVAVVNTDWGGHLLEFGSKNNPAHAPLRRAVRATGLQLVESR